MPPKLRKEKSTPGSKPASSTTNMFDVLTDDPPKHTPPKITHDTGTMVTTPQQSSPSQLEQMQNDIRSMVHIVNALSSSLRQMEKLDKIDEIEARQKSSETMLTTMITKLSSEFDTKKQSTAALEHNASLTYADILKTTEKQNKNNTTDSATTQALKVPAKIPDVSSSTDTTTTTVNPPVDTATLETNTRLLAPPYPHTRDITHTLDLTKTPPDLTHKPPQVTTNKNTPNISSPKTPVQNTQTQSTVPSNPSKIVPPIHIPTMIQTQQNPPTSHAHYTHGVQNHGIHQPQPQQSAFVPNNQHHSTNQSQPHQFTSVPNNQNAGVNTTMPHPNSNQNTSTHRYWKLASSESHQPHRFLQYMENIKLNGDSISHLRQFYERIRLAFHSSFTKPTDILPQFRDISPHYPFGNILIPNNVHYVGYHAIYNTYNWFGTALYASLTDMKMINPKLAPLASRVIVTDKTETDGWSLLYLLLCSRNPLLGGKGDDVIAEITNLHVRPDEDIHKFYERVMNIQEKLEFSTEIISKTKLVEKYLHAMAKSTIHHHLLQYFIIDLNIHIAQQGHDTDHPTMSIHSIYQHLLVTNAPQQFQIRNVKKFKPNISKLSTNQDQTETNDFYNMDDNDKENIIETQTIDTPSSNYILYDDNNEQHYLQYDPTIQAFRHHSNQRSKIVCDACGLPGHPSSKCFRRGFPFLPRDVQRRIAAYNTKYGDTPQTDTSKQTSGKELLPAPEIKLPNQVSNKEQNNTKDIKPNTPNATIHKLQHVLPNNSEDNINYEDDDIEFLTPIEMDNNTPVINTLSPQSSSNTKSTTKTNRNHINPLSVEILNNNAEVNVPELHALQDSLLSHSSIKLFTPHRQQSFHVDTGANVHATTNKKDFLVFYQQQKSINIAAGQVAQSEGYGVVMVQIIPNQPPIPLAPVYFCPNASTGTLSPQCLQLYNNCKSPTHRLFEHVSFTGPYEDKITYIPTTQHNNLDFLTLTIMHFSNNMIKNPTIARLYTEGLNSQLIHQKFDHRSMEHIINMKRDKLMKNLPTNITKFHDEYSCPICLLTKATKVRRNKAIPTRIQHKKGELLCMDYSFWNKPSIRGFTSLLSVICMTTRFSFAFPTRHKRPPLATIEWLIEILRKQGFPVTYIQTDEGGELGRSSDFLKLLTNKHCIFLGTGRSGSSLNGLVERPNRTIAEAVRAKLTNANLGDEFWCFAAEDTVFKQRRILHTAINTTPYYAWFHRTPDYSDMRIFGSHVYVVNTDVTRQKLDARTFLGLYLKFASTTRVVVYYNPQTKKIGRSSHVYFDELNIGLNSPNNSKFGMDLIAKYPHIPDQAKYTISKSQIQDIPILTHPITTYKIVLPQNNEICSIKFYNDEKYGLPYIKSIPPSSFIGKQLPKIAHTQQYLISLENEEPIHATSATEEFQKLRRTHASKVITLQLSKREQAKPANYEQLRTKFDQLRPVIAANNTNSNQSSNSTHTLHPENTNDVLTPIAPTVAILTHSPVKPIPHKNVMECFNINNPHHAQWKYTAFEQYDKNASYRVFTKPQPLNTLPPDVDVLKSVLASTVKPTENEHLWLLGLRHCVNGKLIKGIDKYGPTYAPTISPDTLRFQLAYSAAFGFQLQTGNCSNAFQCTHEPDPDKRIWCYLPPYYLQWWNLRYPNDTIDPTTGPFAMQAAQNIQGTPHAGNRWKNNLDAQLTKHGYVCNNVDKAFYTYHIDQTLVAMLSTTVDDFLLSFKEIRIRDHFFSFMTDAFDVTTPGIQQRLKFLSLHIYQSKHGISFDQTCHIHTNVISNWFQNRNNYTRQDTPIKAHPTYEYNLAKSPPLSADDLKKYEVEYKGAFNHTIGKLLHIQQWSRPDLNFAISRLAVYAKSPTSMAFEALDHLMAYLMHHIHEPIFYPAKPIGPDEIITYYWSKHQKSTYTTKSTYIFHMDAAFANILPDRRSMQANVGLLNGVVTSWGCNIQSAIAADSTDAETKAIFHVSKRACALRNFLTSAHFDPILNTPFHIYVDNKATIGLVLTNKLTARSRHLDIPIAFSHDRYILGYYTLEHISRKLNAADPSTKACTGPVHQRHWEFLRGMRFYPPPDTEHGKYLRTTSQATTVLSTGK